MTVSHGVEGQLISEARICIYSDIKALTRRGKHSAKWHECHFAKENSRSLRMIVAEEMLIRVAEENICRV